MTKDEVERVRKEVFAMRGEGLSIQAIADKLGEMSATTVSLWLRAERPNGISEQNARKIARARGLPDDFWRNSRSLKGVRNSATEDDRVRWVAQQLGFHEADLLKLWRDSAAPKMPSAVGDEEMHGLPDDVWAAAMATVHLEDVTIEQALRAAVRAWADLGEKGGTKKQHWLEPIKERLGGKRRESGSRPRIRLGPAEKK